MQIFYADRVKETSTTTGTGTYTLAGAVAGFQSFAAIGNGIKCYYVAEDGTNWEVGIGTYTAAGATLARTQILKSSNANAAVNWPAGSRNVFCTPPASAWNPYAFDPTVVMTVANAPYIDAAAARALVAGSSSFAYGVDSIAFGTNAGANNAQSIAIGLNSAGNATNAVAIGNGATVTGAAGVAIGAGNGAGAGGVSIGGGQFYAAGSTNGKDAVNIGGSYNFAAGDCSRVMGLAAKSRFFGADAHGGGAYASTAVWGSAQSERVIQYITTTNGTTTPLELNGNAAAQGYLAFPANFDCAVVVHVVGREAATGDSIAFRLEGLLHSNGSGVPSLVGSTPAAVDLGHAAGAATWTAALAVDAVTHNCLLVNVTGQAAKTIKWVARIMFVEVGA